MVGDVVAMKPEDYARWSAAQPEADDIAKDGEKLFRALGCSGCHALGATVHAPALVGLYGQPVHLTDGRTLVADDAYIRDSILRPGRDIVDGYPNIMPSFSGLIGDDEILALTAYIRSLRDQKVTAR